MTDCPWPMAELLPHRPPLVLLDSLLRFDDESALAQVCLRPDHPFARPQGVPVHVGIELMAQACGAHVGALAKQAGAKVQLGFLLGTRAFSAGMDWFAIGSELEVAVRRVFSEDGMGVYDCRIALAGAEVAQAQLSLYQPRDVEQAISRLRGGENG